MAAIPMLMVVLCIVFEVHSLMEFPLMGYDEEEADETETSSPSTELSFGPSLDMESLASDAEGALAALTDSVGISLSKPKKKSKIRVSSGTTHIQNRTTAWTSPKVEVKSASLQQAPCVHLSSDNHIPSQQILVSPKVDINKPSVPIGPIISKVDISTNNKVPNSFNRPPKIDITTKPQYFQVDSNVDTSINTQYAILPPKADISSIPIHSYVKMPSKVDVATNHQYVNINWPSELGMSTNIPLPAKELDTSRSLNFFVGSHLMPSYSQQQSTYAVKENPVNLVPLNQHSTSPLYKDDQVFSHTSNPSSVLSSLSSSVANRSPVHFPITSTTIANTNPSSPNFPKEDDRITSGFGVTPIPLSYMVYAVRNHSEVPFAETQSKLNSYYSHNHIPPLSYYPLGPFCHHSNPNLPPISGSVLPRPFSVPYQPPRQPHSAERYYTAVPQTYISSYAPQDSQAQQEYYYSQTK